MFDGPLEKQNIIESQERESSHVNLFIRIFNAPNIQNEIVNIEFIEKTINAQLPDHSKDPELPELVKTYQLQAHSRTWWKYNKNEYRFSYDSYFMIHMFSQNIHSRITCSNVTNYEKQEVLTWRDTLIK